MANLWRIRGEKTAETWRVSPSFLCENLSMEPRRAAGNVPPLKARRFSSQKGRDEMDAVNRLIQAGIRPDCAAETVLRYEARGDAAGLERYVTDAEQLASERKGERACLAV